MRIIHITDLLYNTHIGIAIVKINIFFGDFAQFFGIFFTARVFYNVFLYS